LDTGSRDDLFTRTLKETDDLDKEINTMKNDKNKLKIEEIDEISQINERVDSDDEKEEVE